MEGDIKADKIDCRNCVKPDRIGGDKVSDIRIHREHGMSMKKAKQAAERIASELAEEFDIEYAWEGNRLEFTRAGVQGFIAVGKKEVEIHARLGMMLSLLRGRIEAEIHRFCDENFGAQA